jgi:phage terminase large subunit-like protein
MTDTTTPPAPPPIVDRDPATYSHAERLIVAGLMQEFVDDLDDEECEALFYSWDFWRRPGQVAPPGKWLLWYIRAGRGYGKTRTGAEETRRRVVAGKVGRVGIVAPTAGDARDIMVEGESGLLAVHHPIERPKYQPSKRRLTWPNGAVGTVYSAEEPDRLRGPQHDWVWGDEPASKTWSQEAFDNIVFGLRLGRDPRMMLTGTPKRVPWLTEAAKRDDAIVSTGSTYENRANLADPFVAAIFGRYEGTRVGRREIHGEELDDVEGALWKQQVIEKWRMGNPPFDRNDPDASMRRWLVAHTYAIAPPDRRRWRTVVAVDPPGETAECGIVVVTGPTQGRAGFDHAVVLDDLSMAGPPEEWGARVVFAVKTYGAECWVESNYGGDMARSTIHAVDPTITVRKIKADESKTARAEPVSALYEKGWVHHAQVFAQLEDQMTSWVPADTKHKSPDRLDALVHAVRVVLAETRVVSGRVASAVSRRLPT